MIHNNPTTRSTAPITAGSIWLDPDSPEDRLRVDFVGGWPVQVHYHWLDKVNDEVVYGDRRASSWPFVPELRPEHIAILRTVSDANNAGRCLPMSELCVEGTARNTTYSRVQALEERCLLVRPTRSELHTTQAGEDFLVALEAS